MGVKPRGSVCMYNFYVEKPLLGLGKVARGTQTYATRALIDEVPQYLERVVRKAVHVANYFRFIGPQSRVVGTVCRKRERNPVRLGCRIGLITFEV